jgi:hypothetical protein
MSALLTNCLLEFNSKKIWVLPEAPSRLASVFRRLWLMQLLELPEGIDLTSAMFILDAAPSSLKELLLVMHVELHVPDGDRRGGSKEYLRDAELWVKLLFICCISFIR